MTNEFVYTKAKPRPMNTPYVRYKSIKSCTKALLRMPMRARTPPRKAVIRMPIRSLRILEIMHMKNVTPVFTEPTQAVEER